jgi:hypothetical protein
MFSNASRHPLPSARVLKVMSSLSSLSTSSHVRLAMAERVGGRRADEEEEEEARDRRDGLLVSPGPAAAASTADRCGKGASRVCRSPRSAVAMRERENGAAMR